MLKLCHWNIWFSLLISKLFGYVKYTLSAVVNGETESMEDYKRHMKLDYKHQMACMSVCVRQSVCKNMCICTYAP